ncbi:MAG: DUF814 domain-containing protein [Blastocatellia bacterium]|nr:DUF814 domain-containing protein [Blastocatellia bacterium]
MEARAKESSPYSAFISLLSDLERSSVKARLYSPSGLQDSKIGLIDPKANLLVSFFPFKLGEGLVEDRFPTLNSAVDRYFQILASVESFQNRKRSLVAKAKAEVLRLDTLLEKLATQRQEFTESSLYKETGELILANLSTLYREDNKLYLINYFHPDQIETSIGIESNETPQQAAERFFKLYQRGKRGLEAVEKRIKEVQREAKSRRSHLENILAIVSKSQLDELDPQKPKNKKAQPISGIRRYISSDGFEILVGRSDAGNDQLTFKIAKAADIWLHAADYPGSHVLIVNPERKEIPQKTIYEGAQLAAFFSKAKGEKSAAVRYTERKNISRPKNAKPGLALLLKFKTILVPPFESGNRLL